MSIMRIFLFPKSVDEAYRNELIADWPIIHKYFLGVLHVVDFFSPDRHWAGTA